MKQREGQRARRLDQLRLGLERLLLRGLHYRLLLAASIVLLVALLGGLLMRVLAPGFDEVGESVWTDPGYLGDDEGLVGRTVSTMVTVLGYLLFLGLLIAILTQWMNELIERIESGDSGLDTSNTLHRARAAAHPRAGDAFPGSPQHQHAADRRACRAGGPHTTRRAQGTSG
jgi:hypothetical protein